MPTKQEEFRSFIRAYKETLTRSEFKDAFARVTKMVQEAIADLTRRIDMRLSQVKDGHTPTSKELTDLIRPLIPKVKDGETPSDERLRSLIAPLIPAVENGEPGKDADEEAIKTKIEADLPQLGEAIRNALELLQGTNRLRITAIDGLEEALKEHAKVDFGAFGPGGGTSFSISQSGVQKVQQPLALDFKGAGAPTITLGQNGVTHLDFPSGGTPTWYRGEQLTIAGDNVTITLAHAPTAVLHLSVDRQPQITGLDYTGTIDGVNKTFVFTSPVDTSLQSTIYADYS